MSSDWLPYAAVHPGPEAVVGDVRVLPAVAGQGLAARDILVLVPPSYSSDRALPSYPVLYMHDGQNIFDERTSFAGTWGVNEAVPAAASEGRGEVFVVAVPNGHAERLNEYGPWPVPWLQGGGGNADAYLSYLSDTVAPLVRAEFPIRTDAAGTAIAGSSMGGLVSLYAILTRPDLYGFCGAFSPALLAGSGEIFDLAAGAAGDAGRIYLDVGTAEALMGDEREPDGATPYVAAVRRMRTVLEAAGAEVRYVEEDGGEHNEPAWRRRFPAVLDWFLETAGAAPADPAVHTRGGE